MACQYCAGWPEAEDVLENTGLVEASGCSDCEFEHFPTRNHTIQPLGGAPKFCFISAKITEGVTRHGDPKK